jgi:hypothetical protein
MNSNAVPFLVFQLTNTVPTMGDTLLASAQNVSILSNYVKHVPLSKKREYAARALAFTGPNAKESAPILIAIWQRESNAYIGMALNTVLNGHGAWYQRYSDREEFEAAVNRSARERYPSLFPTSPVLEQQSTNEVRNQ